MKNRRMFTLASVAMLTSRPGDCFLGCSTRCENDHAKACDENDHTDSGEHHHAG